MNWKKWYRRAWKWDIVLFFCFWGGVVWPLIPGRMPATVLTLVGHIDQAKVQDIIKCVNNLWGTPKRHVAGTYLLYLSVQSWLSDSWNSLWDSLNLLGTHSLGTLCLPMNMVCGNLAPEVSSNRNCKSFARKCEKTVHPVITADHCSALCVKPPL